MELPLTFDGQENVPDKTCILAGTFFVERLFSPHFDRMMPHVTNVPGRTAIEIHPASYPKNILGCIAIGNILFTPNPTSVDDVVLSESDLAFSEFENIFDAAIANGEKVTITFQNDF